MAQVSVLIMAVLMLAGCGGSPKPVPTVVFAGDSLTQQWQWYWGKPFGFTDMGVGGNTSIALQKRFPSILEANANTVHIWIGTNDAFDDVQYQTVPLEVTERNISAMVAAARDSGKSVIVGTTPPVMVNVPQAEEINQHIREENAWIRSQGFTVADYYSALELDGSLNPAYCRDGRVHLNRAAYEAMAPILQTALEGK